MSQKPISVYIHYPYCSIICNYCNFTKFLKPTNARVDDIFEIHSNLQIEQFTKILSGRPLNSIYFGGGTPSLAKPNTISAIIKKLHSISGVFSEPEITLEVNPGKINKESLIEFKAAGVNRLSLGIQALDDEALKYFGRDHTRSDALRLIDLVEGIFHNYSGDFIWARPTHLHSKWRKELEEILKLGIPHLSLYQLTLENGTALHRAVVDKKVSLPNENDCANLYDLTRIICRAFGYSQYEISSFAKLGFESKHNMSYWTGLDYIGIGPGAHGRFYDLKEKQVLKTKGTPSPSRWAQQVAKGENGMHISSQSTKEFSKELLVFGLRLINGIDSKNFETLSGFKLEDFLDLSACHDMEDLGMVRMQREGSKIRHIRFTFKGISLSDRVLCEIMK